MVTVPRFWLYETSGVLRPAIMAYLRREPMTAEQIAAMRAYLRQWINAGAWLGPDVDKLRNSVDDLTDTDAISRWLALAAENNIDPL